MKKTPIFWVFVSLMESFGARNYNLFISLEANKLQDSRQLCPGIVRLHGTDGVQLIGIIPQNGKEAWLELQSNCRRAAVPWELQLSVGVTAA